jgi:hypothetical protein
MIATDDSRLGRRVHCVEEGGADGIDVKEDELKTDLGDRGAPPPPPLRRAAANGCRYRVHRATTNGYNGRLSTRLRVHRATKSDCRTFGDTTTDGIQGRCTMGGAD